MEPLAPVCLFTYNRLAETRQTVEALKANFLAKETTLIIFSDGAKNTQDAIKVDLVRSYIARIDGFKEVIIHESLNNKGLAKSIISGVTSVVNKYGKVIVLEDDLITSRNFLDFMNQGLTYYNYESNVLSISGFSFSDSLFLKSIYDNKFGYRASSWGWATWADRWGEIDWNVNAYGQFKGNYIERLKFNKGGSDMSKMLDKQMNGRINSWAIRFCFHQFKHHLVDVYPVYSKVLNIGFGTNATNSFKGIRRFSTYLDDSEKREFFFKQKVFVLKRDAFKFYFHYSYIIRFFGKLEKLI